MRFRVHKFRSSLRVAGSEILEARLPQVMPLCEHGPHARSGGSQLLGLSAMLNVCQSHLDTLGVTSVPLSMSVRPVPSGRMREMICLLPRLLPRRTNAIQDGAKTANALLVQVGPRYARARRSPRKLLEGRTLRCLRGSARAPGVEARSSF